jgi:DNA-binding response OmpR family regulator
MPSETESLVVYGEPVSPELARTLDLGGYAWKAVANADDAAESEPPGGWAGAIIDCGTDASGAWAFARTIRKRDPGNPPVLALVSGAQLADLELRDELFDDFCLAPFHPAELEARVRHLLWRVGGGTRPDMIEYRELSLNLELRDELFDDFCLAPFHPAELEARVRHLLWRVGGGSRPDMIEYRELSLNLETYQASIASRPLDLTYMEYELLKFLAQNPGKVFTREMLLNRVWGYEYYGGARTVDVHVRRLRAKLGEEHAGLIQTVRSVGYRFGQSRWGT